MNKKLLLALSLFIIALSIVIANWDNFKINERQGCCSHHGGVCGCYNGRARCCDGALSPSCGCY